MLLRNSPSWRNLFACPFADVVLGHHHGGTPKLIFGLQDVAAGLGLVRTYSGAQIRRDSNESLPIAIHKLIRVAKC